MSLLKAIIVAVVVTCGAVYCFKPYAVERVVLSAVHHIVPPAYTNMPPGYTLEYDTDSGLYRPVNKYGALFWIDGQGSRQAAINRAWRQYNYDTKKDAQNWVGVE